MRLTDLLSKSIDQRIDYAMFGFFIKYGYNHRVYTVPPPLKPMNKLLLPLSVQQPRPQQRPGVQLPL